MRLALRVGARIAVPPPDAYAWWTDYTENDHAANHFNLFRWAPREIISRDAQGRVVSFRDPGRALGLDTSYVSTLTYDPPRAVLEDSRGPIGPFWAEYAFRSDGQGGTRVVWTIVGEVIPLWAQAFARMPGWARSVAYLDLVGHVAEMKRDLLGVPVPRALDEAVPGGS